MQVRSGGMTNVHAKRELLDELQQLRMENAYLKKLKALAQPDEPARDTEPKSCKS
jgi:hypothetical protein